MNNKGVVTLKGCGKGGVMLCGCRNRSYPTTAAAEEDHMESGIIEVRNGGRLANQSGEGLHQLVYSTFCIE